MRLATLNLWGERGPIERRLPLAVEGLRAIGADVIALQEVRELPGLPNLAETIAGQLGMRHVFAPAMQWGGGVEGVAILTREPLAQVVVRELPHASEALRRVVLAGRVTTAEGSARIATTHLHYRLEHGREREDQALALDALFAAWPGEVRVLLADLNATPDSDEVRFLCGQTTLRGRRTFLQDAWALHHGERPGHTWAKENAFTAQMRWLRPGRRIDYVLVSAEEKDGRGEVMGCEIALDRPVDGVWASDHYALVADVRVAPRQAPGAV